MSKPLKITIFRNTPNHFSIAAKIIAVDLLHIRNFIHLNESGNIDFLFDNSYFVIRSTHICIYIYACKFK